MNNNQTGNQFDDTENQQPGDSNDHQYNNNDEEEEQELDNQPQANQYGGGDDEEEEDDQQLNHNNYQGEDDNNEHNNEAGEDEDNQEGQAQQYEEEEDGKQNEFVDDEELNNNNNNQRNSNLSNNRGAIQDQQGGGYKGSKFGVAAAIPNQSSGSGNFLRNKDILDNFFKNYGGDVQNYFSEFKQKQMQDNEDGDGTDRNNSNLYSSKQNNAEVSIVASDVPLVLRISFYYDNITFHPSESDTDELFNKPNSYKSIMDSLQKFFAQKKNIRNFDQNQTKVTYSDFVEFSYFFIENNDSLFLTQGGKEELWIENQESPLERELKENIEKYENLLKNKVQTPQEKLITQNTIDNLKAQLALLQNKDLDKNKGGKSKAQLSKDQIRMKNLKEAFQFYSKQQNITGATFTFDRIVHEQNVINLACFQLFLKHFGILNKNKYVTKREIQIMFKKYALNYKELDLDHFKIMIEKCALAFYKEEENLNNIDRVEKLYQLMEIDNLDRFRAKFSLLNQPFSIQVKDGFRLLPFDQGREIYLKKVDPQVKEKIKERKEMKKLQSIQMFSPMDRESIKNIEGSKIPRSTEHRRSTPTLYKDQLGLQQSSVYSQPGLASYANKKIKNQVGKMDNNGKVSWQQLEQLSFSDMKNINNGQFRPTDLFNENDDDEDKIYLAEYNLQEDRQRKMQESIMNKKGQENYGQIKESVRPSLRYLQKQNPNYGKNGYSPSLGNIHRGHGSAPEYYSPQNHISSKQLAINQSYMQRAQQVDQDQKMKEKILMQNIINNNDQKIQRGVYAANKRK